MAQLPTQPATEGVKKINFGLNSDIWQMTGSVVLHTAQLFIYYSYRSRTAANA